jgi:pimeloyl-ACP methyl ester carboxylesterase
MPYVRNGNIRIHYQIEGSGQPLVMQHGFTDSLASWYDNGYVDLLKRDYLLILIDARGHGDSDKPHDTAAYAMEHRVADIVSVIDEILVSRAHYFGYSMGGWIGFGMAKHAPDRLRSLIIGGADAAPRKREPHPLLTPEMMSRGAAAIPDAWDAPMPPAMRERVLKNDMEAIRASRVDDPGYEDILPTIAVPCLLLAGDKDPVYPAAKAHAAKIPHAKFVATQDLNHVGTLFRSDLMAAHITQFLRGVA